MSIFKKLTSAAFAAVFTLTLAGFASAQDNSTTATPEKATKERREGRGMGRHGGFGGDKRGFGHRGGMGMFRGLNLSDAQKEQMRTIMEANKPSQAVRDEMKSIREARKNGTELTADQKARLRQLREQGKANRQAVHAQLLAILTSEQRQQLETRKAEMEKRRQEFRQRRQGQAPADKPTDN
jgi:Spy/CpxP family protein refolding chaperone